MRSVVVTMGEPAGCGPLISLKAINTFLYKYKNINFYLVGDEKILMRYSLYSKLKKLKRFFLIDINTPAIDRVKAGEPSTLSARASFIYIKKALEFIKEKNIKSLVTAPVSKEGIKKNFPEFCGHTEYLASVFGVRRYAMLMFHKDICLAFLTRHLPLGDVSEKINRRAAEEMLSLLIISFKNLFKKKNPKFAFVSLNPHAGINTYMLKEEKEMYKVAKKYKYAFGPYPADSIFLPSNRKKYDCLICPYHDLGMVPFKIISAWRGVNLTLGLPIIRTSPAHGVGYEAVKEGKVISSSMEEAIKLALKLKIPAAG